MTRASGASGREASGTILLIAADQQGSARLAAALRREGLGVLEPQEPGEALALARAVRPGVAVLDLRAPGLSFLMDRLHNDGRCGRPALALLVPPGVTPVPTLAPRDEVEVIEWNPLRPDPVVGHVVEKADRQRELRAASPLTGLPGNAAIRDEIERRIGAGEALALMYVDVDAFKPYNDRYGFLRGDDVLRMLASLIVREAGCHPDSFVGHVGGDDFVVILAPEDAEPTAGRILHGFELMVPQIHEAEDVSRGYVAGRDRLRRRCRWPLLSLSIGIARSDRQPVCSALEMVDIATEMKGVAKRASGNAIAVDQRGSRQPMLGWRVRALGTAAASALRRVATIAAVLVLAAALFVPVGSALAHAKPGEPLWPVARTLEDTRLALAGAEAATLLRLHFAAERLADAVTALSVGDDELATAALGEYRRRHDEAAERLATAGTGGDAGTLSQVSLAYQRQARLLTDLVDARCEPDTARSCPALRAALASVSSTVRETQEPGSGSTSSRSAPEDLAPAVEDTDIAPAPRGGTVPDSLGATRPSPPVPGDFRGPVRPVEPPQTTSPATGAATGSQPAPPGDAQEGSEPSSGGTGSTPGGAPPGGGPPEGAGPGGAPPGAGAPGGAVPPGDGGPGAGGAPGGAGSGAGAPGGAGSGAPGGGSPAGMVPGGPPRPDAPTPDAMEPEDGAGEGTGSGTPEASSGTPGRGSTLPDEATNASQAGGPPHGPPPGRGRPVTGPGSTGDPVETEADAGLQTP